MRIPHLLRVFQVAWFLLAASLWAQTASQQPDVYPSQTTLRSNTRLVVVDVVVTDSKGQPVTGLNAEDFTVLENGAQQKISSFSFQHPGETQAISASQLPPNVVTNAPLFHSSGLDVILFDSVNGAFTSQAYARDQLIKFFRSTTLDRPVALFSLENRLRLLQDFTTNAAALQSALEKYKPIVQAATTESFESRESAFDTKGNYHTNALNIETTLNQLNVLAKILGGYPGRKNLIWLSESFPLDLYPDEVLPADNGGLRPDNANAFTVMLESNKLTDFASEVKKVADSMMSSQVAVYPVDAGGVGKDDRSASQHTANDLASRTGGKAFHNTNDLAGSMRSGIDDGASYYTLTYSPDNMKWDGRFRVIQVKTSQPGVTLRYRLGYYATDPEKRSKEEADHVNEDFSRSLEFGSPTATAIRFQAGVNPPSSQTKGKVVVNFAIDPRTVLFQRSSDGMEHASVSCTVWAYAKDKEKPIMSKGDTSRADLKPEVYAQLMRQYFPCKQELDLKSGVYTLRLGVLDRNSNLFGATSASVTVP